MPVPATDRLAFNIIRNDSVIGEHTLSFAPSGDALTVSIAVDIVVGLGPIALFRYKHRATEAWLGGRVDSIDTETNDDGTALHMTARRDESGLVVEGSRTSRYVAAPNMLPGSHWNRKMLDAPFINTQDGRLMKPSVSLVGIEKLDVTGGSVQVRHYALRGDADLDTYYDLTSSWVGLRFVAKDGSAIRYVKA